MILETLSVSLNSNVIHSLRENIIFIEFRTWQYLRKTSFPEPSSIVFFNQKQITRSHFPMSNARLRLQESKIRESGIRLSNSYSYDLSVGKNRRCVEFFS